MTAYFLSILIPVWNGKNYIKDCIGSLFENSYEKFEILLIAGGLDRSYEEALKFNELYSNKIHIFAQKIPNKKKALNIGLNHSKGQIIVLTDIDCIFNENWLELINKIFQEKEINVATSGTLPFHNRKSSLAEYKNIMYSHSLVGRCENSKVIIGNKFCGANSMFRKNIFSEKIKKLVESVQTGEDKILGISFNRNGENVYYFHDLYVYTEHFSNKIVKYIKHKIRWTRHLFIEFKRKDNLTIIPLLGIGLFKLFYPLAALLFWFIFFKSSILWLLIILLLWLLFYFIWVIGVSYQPYKRSKIVIQQLKKYFNPFRAFRIIHLMFFMKGVISVINFINPYKKN